MKVIKLDSRHVLGRYGFTHAFRFDRENKQSDAVKQVLYQIHGQDAQPWNRYWHYNNQTAPWGYYRAPKKPSQPYWIGVKNPADVSAVMLMLAHV